MFEKLITLDPAYDKRHSDPNKNYGIHGMDNYYILVKDQKAVQFVLYLPVHLDHVAKELSENHKLDSYNPFEVLAADVGYHSPYPLYEGQSPMESCKIIDCPCYYDGSGLHAEKVWI